MSWYFCCYALDGSCAWSDIRVAMLCTLRGTWVDTFAATLFIFHVHEVTYGALFVVHELILLLLRSWWFMCMKWHTCCYAVRPSWYMSWYFAATLLMVHVREVTYMLLRCAAFVVHELILLLLRSSWFMCMKWHTCCYAVHSWWYMSWYFCCYAPDGSCQFMCMKWHTCCYAAHSSWYMSWYFCCYNPHGLCAWSDIRVATRCALRGTWVDTFAATLLMVHVSSCAWSDIRVATLCTLDGTWVDTFAAMLLMVHVHEVTYVLLRGALFVVH